MKASMHAISKGIELSYSVDVNLEIRDYYPAVINDHTLFKDVKSLLKERSYELIKPMMFAEDFSFYQQKVPGLFMMLGTKNEKKGYTHPLHSCYFDFDEKVLTKALSLYDDICKFYGVYK